MAQFVPTYTHAALDVLATERKRVVAERDAFATFHERIDALNASQALSADNHILQGSNLRELRPSSDTQLQRAQEAYRETLMSVAHYEAEYDESLAENLAGEFTPTVASAMTTSDSFTLQLRERLLAESQQSYEHRRVLLTALNHERDRLRTASEEMSAMRSLESSDVDTLTTSSLDAWSRDALTEFREELRSREQRCNDLAADRQATLRTTRIPGPQQSRLSLGEYLYGSLSVSHPVLADLAELADALQTARCRIERTCDAWAREECGIDSRML